MLFYTVKIVISVASPPMNTKNHKPGASHGATTTVCHLLNFRKLDLSCLDANGRVHNTRINVDNDVAHHSGKI